MSVRPFVAPAPTRRIALAWRKSFPRLQAVHVVADAVRVCAATFEMAVMGGDSLRVLDDLTV